MSDRANRKDNLIEGSCLFLASVWRRIGATYGSCGQANRTQRIQSDQIRSDWVDLSPQVRQVRADTSKRSPRSIQPQAKNLKRLISWCGRILFFALLLLHLLALQEPTLQPTWLVVGVINLRHPMRWAWRISSFVWGSYAYPITSETRGSSFITGIYIHWSIERILHLRARFSSLLLAARCPRALELNGGP